MNEIWLPIIGYEGYEVSNYGNVRSLGRIQIVIYKQKSKTGEIITRTDNRKPKNLKFGNSYGYNIVTLYTNGNRKTIHVHKLVANTFIPNPDNKPEVNHKDGVKTNNNVFNLEFVTKSENVQHAYDTGLHKGIHPVIQLDKAGNILNRFGSAREVQRKIGINHTCITHCCLGKKNRKSAGGYVWKFDDIV